LEQQIFRNIQNEFNPLNYDAVCFDSGLKDCKYISVSLAPDVILYTIEYPHVFDGETKVYLKSAFPPRVMGEFIRSAPINLYPSTVEKLEYSLRRRYKSPPFDIPCGPSRRLIPELKDRMKILLNRSNVRILCDHKYLKSGWKSLGGKEHHIIQRAMEAWKNREFDFGYMQFILFSLLEKAMPLTFDDNLLTFMYREEIPCLETRVPSKLSTELSSVKVIQQI
jgi:hypothetical protein